MTLAFDPLFRDLNRLTTEVFGTSRAPQGMAMDAYRAGENYVAEFDLPGIDPDSLEVRAENNTLTVRAQRQGRTESDTNGEISYIAAERPRGTFSRQLALGDGLDLDNITADYADGVLTVTMPVAEQAKPRQIQVGRRDTGGRKVIDSGGS
ncbi:MULTISPECIES: Hsp20/alpha crystallin family protein [Saccharopolyspora]|uniref:Molecular chaperone Hsp18 n=1 Tax=Saccharopolyspora gregorii TaxID=33914 RepID=A0ABP6RXY1_9PSEU|nr:MULTISPECIES: Hsp20/alpha crystallin family protein [unclassified Saccharopolyspora]MCA1186226.1 Hsp20/alpha crystallin family protein [Saccharopolyspora sp. 6T]MCA1194638.1 Hsp20/alpha crystallin family protein [Saccharopolyspora sp. 6V]MCA1229033.1 Hsp20/alpha crystallin family protein [Saccharopolyspora sp. 6M]MCA1278428.1 Hsp20/alpha crystallin family protein [Saccharopolyspora sp. 7B]